MRALILAAVVGGGALLLWARRSSAAATDTGDDMTTPPTRSTPGGAAGDYQIDWSSHGSGGPRIPEGFARFPDLGITQPRYVGRAAREIFERGQREGWPVGDWVRFTGGPHRRRYHARIEPHDARVRWAVSVFPHEEDHT